MLLKLAQAMDPGEMMMLRQQQPDDSKYLRRRRMLAVLLPALKGALAGGLAGNIGGHLLDNQRGTHETPDSVSNKSMLAGALLGGGLGAGVGGLQASAREWTGADPLLNTVAQGRG